jgi:hypothetical protein
MKLLRVLRALLPPVRLQLRPTRDIRDPRVVHKARRARECRKVPVARPFLPEVPGVMRGRGE